MSTMTIVSPRHHAMPAPARSCTSALIGALSCTALLSPGAGHAAAAWLTETGGADTSMAGAGRAAMSFDSAALAANPAAIAGLHGTQATVALLPVKLDFDFRGAGSTPGSAHNEAAATPSGSLFVVHDLGRISLGLGVYSYAGLGYDYGDDWVGRYSIEHARLKTATVAGAAAYHLTDRLDVGATVGAQYADIDAAAGVNSSAALYGPPADLPDGRVTLHGSEWAPAGSVGLLYRATDSTRVGLAWTAPVSHTVPLDMRASGLHPVLSTLVPQTSAGEFEFTLPQQVTLGATTQVTPATLVGLEVGRQDWSAFGHSTMTMMGQPLRILPDGLQDTWNVAAGFRHQLDPSWNVSAGVAYDSSPARRSTVPAYFPVAEQWRFSTGVERRFSDGMVVRGALSVIDMGDVRVSQDRVAWPLPGAGDLSGTVSGSRAYVFCVASDFAM